MPELQHRPAPGQRALIAMVAMVIISGWASLAAAAQPPALSLLQAWQQARASDPTLAAASATQQGAQQAVLQAQAARAPRVQAQWTNQGVVGDGRLRAHETSLSLQQTLFDRSRDARIDQAQAQAQAQDATLQLAEQALAARVATAYFDALASADALRLAVAQDDTLREQVTQATQRHAIGLAALVDVDQARAAQAQARAASVQARAAAADALEALASLTGEPVLALRPLRDAGLAGEASAAEPADAQSWLQQALASHPQLQAAQATLQAADHAVRGARAADTPTVEAAATPYRSAGPGAAAGPVSGTRVSLNLSWSLFNGGAAQAAVRERQHQRDALAAEAEATRRRIVRQVQEQHRAVVTGAAQVQAGAEAVQAAQRAVQSLRAGQQLGTRSIGDVLLAIQQLAGAQAAWSQARHRQVLARLLLRQAAGRLSEADLAAINTLLE